MKGRLMGAEPDTSDFTYKDRGCFVVPAVFLGCPGFEKVPSSHYFSECYWDRIV